MSKNNKQSELFDESYELQKLEDFFGEGCTTGARVFSHEDVTRLKDKILTEVTKFDASGWRFKSVDSGCATDDKDFDVEWESELVERENEDKVQFLPKLFSSSTPRPAERNAIPGHLRDLDGQYLPFFKLESVDQLDKAKRNLKAKFPYASSVIDTLLSQTIRRAAFGHANFDFQHTILYGGPGTGKSTLLRAICDELDVYSVVANAAGRADDQIFGVPKGFSTGGPSIMLNAVAACEKINPVIIIDEIDKSVQGSTSGDLQAKLLPLLEQSEARDYLDVFLQVKIDVSHISYLMTANDLDTIPAPLRSRCRCIEMPSPGPQDVPLLVRQIVKDVARELSVDHRFFRSFDRTEMHAMQSAFSRHKSLRILRRQVEFMLDEQNLFNA